MHTCVLIVGPTASGKTPLAFALAQKINGYVINADSMQIYDHLKILTARLTPEEKKVYAAIPYALDGVLSEEERGSVGWWLQSATSHIKEAFSQEKVPIVVGGTGLYFKALTEGLSSIPEVPPTIQKKVRDLAKIHTLFELQTMLHSLSPASPTYQDKQRLSRALEVILATGHPLEFFHKKEKPPLLDCKFLSVFLSPERTQLHHAIEDRFDAMMEKGTLDEVSTLLGKRLPSDHPLLKATGVPPLKAYLEGKMRLEDAILKAKQDTRQYAKRQMTWFRRQLSADLTLDPYQMPLFEQVQYIEKGLQK